jgi:hypothetical protein
MFAALENDRLEQDTLVAHLAAVQVIGLDGAPVRIREFWRKTTTVTSFVRHFGCLFCHQMICTTWSHRCPPSWLAAPRCSSRRERFHRASAAVLHEARLPCEGVAVVTDPDRDSYRTAGFERLRRTFLHPGAHKAYGVRRSRAPDHGHFGDLTQLGGLLAS